MAKQLYGKATVYYGAGDEAIDRDRRLDAAARKRGMVSERGKSEYSPLFVYCFEVIDALDPEIEAEAARRGLRPAEFINELFSASRKRNRP